MSGFFAWIAKLFGFLKPIPEEIPIDVKQTDVPKEVQRVYKAYKESSNFGDIRYIAEIDYSINSKSPRFFIYDLKDKKLYKHKCAHGQGGKNASPHDGKCREVSNVNGSHMSCLGLFKCAETYEGKSGYSMRIDGLNSTNSNARARAVVVHGSDYVKDSNSVICGRSWGCPAVDNNYHRQIIGMLKNGSPLLSHYAGKFSI